MWHRPTQDQLQVEGLSSEPGETLPVVSHKFRVAYCREPRTWPSQGHLSGISPGYQDSVPNLSPYPPPQHRSSIPGQKMPQKCYDGLSLGGAQVHKCLTLENWPLETPIS